MIKVLWLSEGSACVKKKLPAGDGVFLAARDFYREHPELQEDPITVTGRDGTPLYQLLYATNQCGGEIVVRSKMGPSSEFLHYTYEDTDLDLTMLQRADYFVFDQMDEYTYAIARVLMRSLPEKHILFTDPKAELFFGGERSVELIPVEKAERIRRENPGRVMTVVSEGDFLITRDSIGAMIYNSIQVMNGLYWLTEKVSYGEENPDRTLVLIKSHLGHEGIAGVLRYVLNKLEVIKKTGRDLDPVVDLGIFGEVNQFCMGDGSNVWDMFFEPLSRFGTEDVYNSKNVLLAFDGMKTKNPYLYEQDILADYPMLIKKYLRFKESTLTFCREQMERVIPAGVKRYIGVVGRGTDYNMQLEGKLANYLMRPLSGAEMLKKTEDLLAEGAYDGVFLATEDAGVFETFMQSGIRDRIFYVDQERIIYDPGDKQHRFLADIYKEKTRDGYAENLRYIGIIYILAQASALLSSTLCGAAKIAWGLSENGFDYMDVPGITDRKASYNPRGGRTNL